MFSSSEKVPLKGPGAPDEENNTSSSLYMSAKAPGGQAPPDTLPTRLGRELRSNWWLWGAVGFAVLLVGGLLLFRNSLYDSSAQGLPFLAVKENAAEACATECNEEQVATAALAAGEAAEKDSSIARAKEEFDTCYSKCVAQETKDVQEEREKFKKNEEEFEAKEAEDKEGHDKDKHHHDDDDDDDHKHDHHDKKSSG